MRCPLVRMSMPSTLAVLCCLFSLARAGCPVPLPSCANPPPYVPGKHLEKGTVVKKTVEFVIDDAPGTPHDLYLTFNASPENCYGAINTKFPAGCFPCTSTAICPAGRNVWACRISYVSPKPHTVELEQIFGVCNSEFAVAMDILPSVPDPKCHHAQVEFNLLDAGLVADWNDISLVNGFDRPVTLKSNGYFRSLEVTSKYSEGINIYPLYCDCGYAQNSPPCNQSDFRPCPCHPSGVPQATVLLNGEVVNYVIHWPSITAKR